MNQEKERDLWLRCREGSLDAREELIIAYRPLVFWLAGKLRVFPALRQDVIQEGMLALIGAVDRFDPGRDLRFTTYAYHRIRGQMINLLDRSERRAPIPMDDECLFVEESEAPDEGWMDVAESIERLQGKEAAVVSALFFEGKQPSKVAAEQKMDISHVYRLRRSAVAKIRGWLGLDNVFSDA
ncbi:MAG: sigma-70 family RNA polymerase sigma factor [Synergistaceae bacterium]|jgi:RNA polymerase sporulation-specific sigma factor|nr:sigma-70 family RNA polymerase sigma factor [Synergistaceae bacterium]